MVTDPRIIYEFGPFRMDPGMQVLLRENQPIAVTPKAFETLLALVRRSHDVVTKEELLKEIWPDSFVEESNLSQNIFMLRKALGDTAENRQYIVTLPGKGYRFVAPVRTMTEQGEVLVAHARGRTQIVIEESEVETGQALKTLQISQRRGVSRRFLLPTAGLAVLLAIAAFLLIRSRRPANLSERDTILVADFVNTTGDPVFDGALRQGLTVELEQSPFLSLVSDDRIQQVLRMMGQPDDVRLTPAVARETCERTAAAAVIDGSIAQVGSQYLLTLQAVNCASGESVASTEAQASDKNHVLDALGKMAAEMRNKLGESLSTVQKFNTPLEEATTPSLEALKAFSAGHQATSPQLAIASYKRAVELDPNFAAPYAWLGIWYTTIGEPGTASDYTRKAYELRNRASEPERFFISAIYYKEVTGNLEKAEESCKLWMQAYPRAEMAHTYLAGGIYPQLGRWNEVVSEASESIRLRPDYPPPYFMLMWGYMAVNRLDEANATYRLASERKLNSPLSPEAAFQLAFLQNDEAGMSQQVTLWAGEPDVEDTLLAYEADTAAYSGRLREAEELTRRAMESAERAGEKEQVVTISAASGLREALFGKAEEARRLAMLAVDHSDDIDSQYGVALAFAYAGDTRRAQELTDALDKRFPEATIVQFNYLPTLRAKLALNRGNSSEALEILTTAMPYELGVTTFSPYALTGLFPVFVRGEAYLAAHQGRQAAGEFQKILDHRGIVWNSPIGALAHLQLGRAYAMAGDTAKARVAYQNFLTLWKDADPGIPILRRARAEFSNLR
jgi:DNA-binding winged helix-turn-helix (wHTH) protein/tetratricopeptide (TPR) repeat protein